MKKSSAEDPRGVGVPSCSRWEDHASHIPSASVMVMQGVMREREMRRVEVSSRRCRKIEISPTGTRAGSRRRGAARKAVRAVYRVSSAVGGKESIGGSERVVSPVAGKGTASGVGSAVVGMTGGSAVVSTSILSV